MREGLLFVLGCMLCCVVAITSAAGVAGTASAEDQLFLRQAAIGSKAQAEFARMARQKANHPAVRQLGASAESHARGELGRIGSTPASTGLGAELYQLRDQLNGTRSDDFDAAYLDAQIQLYQRSVSLLEWQISFGGNEQLTEHASAMLPEVMARLEAAQRLQESLRASAPRD